MKHKENQQPFEFENQSIAGWEHDVDVLAERNINIKPVIFKKYRNRLPSTKMPKPQDAQVQSHIELLKMEANYLDNDNFIQSKFPTHQSIAKSQCIPHKKKKAVLIDMHPKQKRISSSSSFQSKGKVSLSVEGKSQTQASFHKKASQLMLTEGDELNTCEMKPSWQTIHCKKEAKPFHKFFQNKRNQGSSNKYRSSLSINQIEGTKLNRLLNVLVNKK